MGSIFMIMTEPIKVNKWMIMLGQFCHSATAVHMHAPMHARCSSASLGNKEYSFSHWPSLGDRVSSIRPPVCHSGAKIHEDCCGCCGCVRASGLGRDWPDCAVDVEDRIKKPSLYIIVMGASYRCILHIFMDPCFIVNSSLSALCHSGLMRLIKSIYYFAAPWGKTNCCTICNVFHFRRLLAVISWCRLLITHNHK